MPAILDEAGELLGCSAAGVVDVLAVKAIKVIGESLVLWPRPASVDRWSSCLCEDLALGAESFDL
ncbi:MULTISPECIES: hypothetical protein [unclassified Streptomyces]|uniref:hypothetical protein n=1 Tax=unclassified Streptomyces TaxID=2593676 RepID=UPI00225B6197|nr:MULTISPECIES: hypothetical protein [unclassified Streptomyces]WSP56738.1 hypothetical protein OG306_21965 [Streptomyces sp. NBC_01241]WSU22544.1 hypothetical protein OG508_17265 [Streptomyces sp. NBC_01108]MCX4788492.1 hypothetical protein [Streptomyces sp. NBC_01221]MCX4795748.1 hypothetical protein [Streptomyces sp. NBC_01242]WSJ37035.1 hypothetical protein OG772_13965 [Streptomyces sp. NBC_01321]